MKWILMIAWASNGTGFTAQEFDTDNACLKAAAWSKSKAHRRGPAMDALCINKATGEKKRPDAQGEPGLKK